MSKRREIRDADGNLLKWCSYGKHALPATDVYFKPSDGHNDGFYPDCRECRHEINRQKWAKKKLLQTKQRINDLKLLELYNGLNSAENSAKFFALRCFLLTGNITLATAFYTRYITI